MARKDRFTTSYKVGQDNIQKWGMDMHNPVFFVSAALVILFVISTLVNPVGAKKIFDATKGWTIENFDWFFMISGNIFVLFCLVLIVLPVGKIRLGGPEAKPEFKRMSWFAMLFAAGMGIGLMFWSVAEPVAYYTDWWGTPLNVAARTPEAASAAMGATMFHWGLHPWAIYAVTALALAFFAFNKGMPLTIRSTFYPILGEKTWKTPGNIIDIIAVLATIFGLATSLGFGAQQASAGLNFLFGIEKTMGLQVTIIVCRHRCGGHFRGPGAGRRCQGAQQFQHAAGRDPAGLCYRGRFFYPLHRRLFHDDPGVYSGHHSPEQLDRPNRRKILQGLDRVLLGLVDLLGTLCGHVHRPHLQGPHHPRVPDRRFIGSHDLLPCSGCRPSAATPSCRSRTMWAHWPMGWVKFLWPPFRCWPTCP